MLDGFREVEQSSLAEAGAVVLVLQLLVEVVVGDGIGKGGFLVRLVFSVRVGEDMHDGVVLVVSQTKRGLVLYFVRILHRRVEMSFEAVFKGAVGLGEVVGPDHRSSLELLLKLLG